MIILLTLLAIAGAVLKLFVGRKPKAAAAKPHNH